tara:strand:+ start:1184 stop:1507 length:324 start_codon:yes stop_codon:yes gene_type:complete
MLYESSRMNTIEAGEVGRSDSVVLVENNGLAKAMLRRAIIRQRAKSKNNLLGRDFLIERFCDFVSRYTAENRICFCCLRVKRWIRTGKVSPNRPSKNNGEEKLRLIN